MSQNDPDRAEETIFEAARQLSDPEKQAAYLDLACGKGSALRQRIEQLLHAGQKAKDFFQKQCFLLPPSPPQATVTTVGEGPGSIVGPYKLLQQIGEGGCGVVYMAEQEEPIRRRVALKVIKLGMDTKQVMARFDAERQALALMDHPNIAKVLDAGATETGRPFFVMELVRGIKITDYCEQNKLTTAERLALFTLVCHAIQHAHQKGIIHRDIKPSNILVTMHDGVPVPKVIDFGIAKATTDQRLTDKTLFTAFEQFIGTPAYMSPEQAEMSGLDIDTRSDIYALGVLLYELLTGMPPFDGKELLASGLDEMRRTIREVEPVKPSKVVERKSKLRVERNDAAGAYADSTLNPQLKSLSTDLDWIVMKCLEKDRTRRYDTANGLASDIQRHLNCEPVVARPPSRLYEFQKTVRRHKFGFAAAASLIAVLAAGVVVSTLEAIRAKKEAAKATAANDLLQEMLSSANPEALKALYRRDAASTTWSLVNLLLLQGKLPEAEQVCRAEVEACEKANRTFPENIDIRNEQAEGRRLLATVLGRLGRVDEAEREYRACIALYPWLKAAAPGNAFYRQEEGYATWTLAELLEAAGRLDASETEYRNAIALHEKASADFPNEAGLRDRLDGARSRLVGFLRRRGRFAEARTVAQDAAQKCQAALTNYEKLVSDPNRQHECWNLAISCEAVGELLRGVGQAQEAEKTFRDAQMLWQKLVAAANKQDNRFHLAVNYDELGNLLREAGRTAESLDSYRSAQAIWSNLVAEFNTEDNRIHLGWTDDYIGGSLKEAKQFDEAAEAYQQAVGVWKKLVADFNKDDHRENLRAALVELAKMLRAQDKNAEAEAVERGAADHGDAGIQNELAWRFATDPDPKIRDGSNAVVYAEKAVAATSRTNDAYLDTLAAAYAEAGQFTNAVNVQQEAVALLQNEANKADYLSRLKLYQCKRPYHDHGLLAEHASALLTRGLFAEAEVAARECLALREIQIPDDWRTFDAQSLLGGALLGQKKFIEAEPLLLTGYEGLKQREDKMPKSSPRLKEALQRLAQFFEATSQAAKAAEWKQKLAELDKAPK